MTTHALITPQPISALRTWCGIGRGDPRAEDSHIAFAPEAVTCPECARMMRQALETLMDWVPRLQDAEELSADGRGPATGSSPDLP